jgi:hypothetical protein
MSATTEIKCDACEADLTYTGNCEDWRLVLGVQSKSPWYERDGLSGGAVTSAAIPRPIPRTVHFCGVGCLHEWLTREYPGAADAYTRRRKHQAWLAANQPLSE